MIPTPLLGDLFKNVVFKATPWLDVNLVEVFYQKDGILCKANFFNDLGLRSGTRCRLGGQPNTGNDITVMGQVEISEGITDA